jgi:putative DNA primase/helicase
MEGICRDFITTATELSSFEISKFFSRIYESRLKFTPQAGWLTYQEDGGIWMRITRNEVKKRIIDLIEALEKVATETKKIQDNLRKLKSKSKIDEIIDFLETFLIKDFSEFDVNPFVLALKNCVFDLETLHYAVDHERANFYVTKQINTNFVEAFIETPPNLSRWVNFLHSILPGDVVDFLQVFLGYSLSGSTEERKLLIFHGSGANGKTTLTNVLRSIWNDYVITVNPNLFIKNSSDKLFCLAHLKGIRLGIVPELPTGVLDASLIKILTGQDKIQARFLYHDFFEFRPTCKWIIICNELPRIEEGTEAIWDRLLVIPFDVRIPEERQIKNLEEILLREKDLIFWWCLKGFAKWRKEGLKVPSSIVMATREYRKRSETIKVFIEETCVINPSGKVKLQDLYRAYTEWCGRNLIPVVDMRGFAETLRNKGFNLSSYYHGGVKAVTGLSFKNTSTIELEHVKTIKPIYSW